MTTDAATCWTILDGTIRATGTVVATAVATGTYALVQESAIPESFAGLRWDRMPDLVDLTQKLLEGLGIVSYDPVEVA